MQINCTVKPLQSMSVAVPEETEGVKVVMVPVFEEKVPSGELQITEVNKPPRVAVKSMEPPVQTMFPPEIVLSQSEQLLPEQT